MSRHPRWPIDEEELGRIRDRVMDLAGIGLYRYNFTGEIIFMDHVVLRMLDLQDTYPDPDELIGKDIGSLFVHVLPPGVHRNEVRRHGVVKDFEYHYHTLSGQERWSYHSSYLARDPSSGEESIQVLCKDITDLRRTARDAEASEARYRGLAEQSPLGIAVVAGIPPHCVFANRALGDLVGMTAEQIPTATETEMLGCIHEDDRDEALAWYRSQLGADDRPTTREHRIRRSDGTVRWVSNVVQSITFGGGPAFQVTTTDITERRHAEATRLAAETRAHHRQRLESLGLLSGGIAHDFNNVLSVILVNAQLAQRRIPADSLGQGNLSDVVEAAQRAGELCRQLLAYSGAAPLVREPFELTRLVRATSKLFEVTVSKRAELRLELAEGLPPVVGEPSQVRQILVNLLSNASDALGGAGTVTVRTGLVECSRDELSAMRFASPEAESGGYVFVEVVDDGCGMSADTVGRVFEPFFTTKSMGRGLGLASVIGIVRSHGGALSVDTAPGRGTRMRVLLPAAPAAATVSSAAGTAPRSWRSGGTVLVCDDEDGIRQSLVEVLAEVGFEVVTAVDGRAAVDRFRTRRAEIRAVVIDLTMPVMDGLTAAHEIRALAPDVPVLFVSGYAAAYRHRIDALPNADLLQKPFRLEQLLERLRTLLGEAAGGSDRDLE